MKYFGFIIDKQGIQTTREKVKAVQDAKVPDKDPRSFLGFVAFYGRFMKNLDTIVHPFHQLLESDSGWNWSADCQAVFEKI